MATTLRHWAMRLVITASAPVSSGSRRNARAALQRRYDEELHIG